MVPGLSEIAELHGQGEHDEVQDGESGERGSGRSGSGRFGADRPQPQDASREDGA